MNKIKLILRSGEFTSFTSYYLEEIWKEFFDIEIYQPDKIYDPRSILAVSLATLSDDTWARRQKELGYKVLVDNLWERPADTGDFFHLHHPCWFLWNESLWWQSLGYDQYLPNKKVTHRAIMPLRRQTPERDYIVARLADWLPTMVYSYVARGIRLPNDDMTFSLDNDAGQRYMHPSWYDSTFCSVVVETDQHGPVFVTEKSCRPLAYWHPFMIVGTVGTLAFLRSQGFETFANIFDESYDSEQDLKTRVSIVAKNLSLVAVDSDYDKLTRDKIAHNHARFFNRSNIIQSIKRKIVQPIVEYAET